MSTIKSVFFLFSILFTTPLFSQTFNVNKAETVLKVEGTSTVRDWSATLNDAALGQAMIELANGNIQFQSLKFSFPVHAMVSSEGGTMNKHMWESLKADKNKNITFELTEFVGFSNGKATVKGNWTMAGKTKVVTLKGMVVPAAGKVTIKGSTEINIIDFDMEPPSLFFGTMNVDPKMTISYEITFSS